MCPETVNYFVLELVVEKKNKKTAGEEKWWRTTGHKFVLAHDKPLEGKQILESTSTGSWKGNPSLLD